MAAAPVAAPAPRPRKPRSNGPAKLFVLDTNVLMHDPMSLFRFEEHDVFLPMITLEELDGHKKGMSEVARNARQVSRDLDALASFTARNGAIDTAAGIELAKTGHREAGGKLYFQTTLLDVKLPPGLPQGKADNQILGVVQSLREQQQAPRRATWCWCPRTSTCASRRARWACRPRTTSTTRRWKTATCSTPACCRCRPTSGSAMARPWRAGSRAATPSTASAGRWCRR